MNKNRILCLVLFICAEFIQTMGDEIEEEEDDEEIKGLERLENWVLGKNKIIYILIRVTS